MLIFTVYALITVEVFGLTRFGVITDDHANFRDFPTALLTLYRMTTGEVWNKIMHEMTVEAPYCVVNNFNYLLSDCGSTGWGLGVFLSFELVVPMMLLSLFIVTVIDNFDFFSQENSMYSLMTQEDLVSYKSVWSEFDPKGTGFIPREQLSKFLGVCQFQTEHSKSYFLETWWSTGSENLLG